jgi:hypothetical protein
MNFEVRIAEGTNQADTPGFGRMARYASGLAVSEQTDLSVARQYRC